MIVLTAVGFVLSNGFINIPNITTAVYASEKTNDQSQAQAIDEYIEDETDEVLVFSLEDLIELALKDNRNLAMIEYGKKIAEVNEEMRKEDLLDIDENIEDLEETLRDLDDLESQYNFNIFLASQSLAEAEAILGNPFATPEEKSAAYAMQQSAKSQLNQIDLGFENLEKQRDSIRKQLDNLKESREQLENALQEIMNQYEQSELNYKRAVEGARLMIIGKVVELQALQEAMALQERNIEELKKEQAKQEKMYEQGLVSYNDYSKINRQIIDQEQSLKTSQEQYQTKLHSLLLDVNIKTDKEVVIKPIDFSKLGKVSRPSTFTTAVKNSIDVQLLEKELETLEKVRENTTDKDSLKIKDNEIEMKKLEIEDKKVEIEKKIEDLYYQAEAAYETMKQAQRQLTYEQQDYQKLSTQYQLGLVSKFDYEKAKMAIEKAEMDYKQAQIQYYMLTEQIKSISNGFIS